MKEKIAKLIDVKSIITIFLTIVFCILSLWGKVNQEFMTVYTVVISFYFSMQYAKKKATSTENIDG